VNIVEKNVRFFSLLFARVLARIIRAPKSPP